MLRRRQVSTSAGPSCTEMGRNTRNADDCVIEMPPDVVNAELPRRRWTAQSFKQLFWEVLRFPFERITEFANWLVDVVLEE